MTLLIVGLGNPGKTYEKTRHNVGFFTLEILYKKLFGFHNFSEFKEEKKFKALVSKKVPNGIILAKPLTFMNNSGESVNLLTDFYKIPTEDYVLQKFPKDEEKILKKCVEEVVEKLLELLNSYRL